MDLFVSARERENDDWRVFRSRCVTANAAVSAVQLGALGVGAGGEDVPR